MNECGEQSAVDHDNVGSGGHPLFPRPETATGPDLRRIDLIHIERYTEDGGKELCPKPFLASELRSWADIVSRYGGGTYVARAQCGRTFQYQGQSEKVTFLSPPPRPFTDDAAFARPRRSVEAEHVDVGRLPPEPVQSRPASVPEPSVAPAGPAPLLSNEVIQALLARTAAQPDFSALFAPLVAAITRPPPTDSMATMVAAVLQSNAELTKTIMLAQSKASPMLDTIRALRDLGAFGNGGGGNGAAEAIVQGIELAKGVFSSAATAAAGAPPAAAAPQDDLGQILGVFTKVMESTRSSAQASPPAQPTAPVAPVLPPPPPPPPGWAWVRRPDGALVPMQVAMPGMPASVPPAAPATGQFERQFAGLHAKVDSLATGFANLAKERAASTSSAPIGVPSPPVAAAPANFVAPKAPVPERRAAPPVVAVPEVRQHVAPPRSAPDQSFLWDFTQTASGSAIAAHPDAGAAASMDEQMGSPTAEPQDVAASATELEPVPLPPTLAQYSSERFPLEAPMVLNERLAEAMAALEHQTAEQGPVAAFESAKGLLTSPDFMAALVLTLPEGSARAIADLGGEEAQRVYDQVSGQLPSRGDSGVPVAAAEVSPAAPAGGASETASAQQHDGSALPGSGDVFP